MSNKWPKNKNIGDVYVNPLGVKWKWNGRGWVSVKESDVVYLTGPTGPAGLSQVFYNFSHGQMDPMDSTSYYIGDLSDIEASSFSSKSRRVKSKVNGSINSVTIMTYIAGSIGSGESQTFVLNNFTSGLSSVITSTYSNISASQLDNFVLSTPLVISVDDELEIIWTNPNYETNPISIRHNFNVYVVF